MILNSSFAMRLTCGWLAACTLIALLSRVGNAQNLTSEMPHKPPEQQSTSSFRGALLAADAINASRLAELAAAGFNAVVVVIDATEPASRLSEQRAAELVLSSSLELHYWIEVARCEELADAHPDWMASLQTHAQWRRLFPDTPEVEENQVAKTHPWVPILSREPFAAQLQRVTKLLADKPKPSGVFLNDLQGAPSACGCGNTLCRWTSDYGDRRTTTPLGDDAATLFVNAIKQQLPESEIVPVWTSECEQQDGDVHGMCAGVGCFEGICWKALARQLGHLELTCERLALLAPYRAFGRDLPLYGEPAGWVAHAVKSMSEMPPLRGGRAVPPSRWITVLQGWDMQETGIAQQIQVAKQVAVAGYIVAYEKLDQSWQPKIVNWR